MPTRQFSRRGFLKLGAATGAAVLTAPQLVHAAGSDVLKIGLVDCGTRGRGSLLDSIRPTISPRFKPGNTLSRKDRTRSMYVQEHYALVNSIVNGPISHS